MGENGFSGCVLRDLEKLRAKIDAMAQKDLSKEGSKQKLGGNAEIPPSDLILTSSPNLKRLTTKFKVEV